MAKSNSFGLLSSFSTVFCSAAVLFLTQLATAGARVIKPFLAKGGGFFHVAWSALVVMLHFSIVTDGKLRSHREWIYGRRPECSNENAPHARPRSASLHPL